MEDYLIDGKQMNGIDKGLKIDGKRNIISCKIKRLENKSRT